MNIKGAFDVLRSKALAVKLSEVTGFTNTIWGAAFVDWLGYNKQAYIESYVTNDIVYSVARVLMNKQLEAPIMLQKIVNEKQYRKYKSIKSQSDDHLIIRKKYHQVKSLEEVESDPLLDLLRKPNTYQTEHEFWEAFWGYYDLTGDAYVYAETPGEDSISKRPVGLHILPSHLVTKEIGGSAFHPEVKYRLTIRGIQLELTNKEVWNFSRFNPMSQEMVGEGLSPLRPGQKVITADQLNTEAQATAFKNGGKVTLLSGDPSKGNMSTEQMNLMKAHIQEQIKGVHNFKNILMTNGYLTATPVGDTLADMELIEASRANRVKVCGLLGVDPALVGDKSASAFNSIQEAYKGLVRNTVLVDLLKRDSGLGGFLLPMFGYDDMVTMSDTSVFSELQPDYAILSSYIQNPKLLVTSDEVRRMFNWDDLDDEAKGSIILVPSGWDTLDNLLTSTSSISSEIDNALKSFGDGDYK